MLAAELFGVKRGAIAGAQSTRIGMLQKADRGTVFLNGIDTHSWAPRTDPAQRVGRSGSKGVDLQFGLIAELDDLADDKLAVVIENDILVYRKGARAHRLSLNWAGRIRIVRVQESPSSINRRVDGRLPDGRSGF